MLVIAEIEPYKDDLIRWRRDVHAHPGLACEEERTAGLVSELLQRLGHRG